MDHSRHCHLSASLAASLVIACHSGNEAQPQAGAVEQLRAVAAAAPRMTPPERRSPADDHAWTSSANCASIPAASETPGIARIASWNVRWFPDGTLDPEQRGAGTDIDWLSCAIARLAAPVVAVQEFRKHEIAVDRVTRLLRLLNERTSGTWRAALDHCPGEHENHVGFLYDEARVRGSDFRNVPELNPEGECESGLHPGFAGYFRFPGGLDLSVISVHFFWGTTAASLDVRRRARQQLHAAARRASDEDAPRSMGTRGRSGSPELARSADTRVQGDGDVMILGDFNTNGCTECGSPFGAQDEIQETATGARAGSPQLELLPNDAACTEYDNGQPLPLDHVLVSASLTELPRAARVRVDGICPLLRCRRLHGDSTAFHDRLSDHCPLVVELIDRDLDP